MFLNGSPEVKQAPFGAESPNGAAVVHVTPIPGPSLRYERVGGKEKKGFSVILTF